MPLLRSTEKELVVAPEGYCVLDSPNVLENGTFCCPYLGCDGRTFDSVEASVEHDENWHSGPYECDDCDAKFAAAPALHRHLRASKHRRRWMFDEDCEITEVRFRARNETTTQDDPTLTQTTGPEAEPWTVASFVVMEQEVASFEEPLENEIGRLQELTLGDFICREECCRRYTYDFKCPSEFTRHTTTLAHMYAASIGKAIEDQELSESELESEKQAIREFRCNATECKDYGRKFASAQSYLNHLGTEVHRHAQVIDLGSLGGTMQQDESEVNIELRCTQEGCPREGMLFTTRAGLRQHFVSTAHVQAKAKAGGSEPESLTKTPLSERRHQVMSPIRVQGASIATPLTPTSPSFGRGRQTPRKTPRRAPRSRQATPTMEANERRLAALEAENEGLHKRLQYLEEQVKKMKEQGDIGGDGE